MSVATLELEPLSPTVGARVLDVDVERLRTDEGLPAAVAEALERHGVLLFRGLHVDPDTQLAFSRKLGDLRTFPGIPVPELFEISRNQDNYYGEYLRGNVTWHFDGVLDDALPSKATFLAAHVITDVGGETEFASSYHAYDLLTADERDAYSGYHVVFSYEASQRRVWESFTDDDVARWRERPTRVHPLVWHHANGRRSLTVSSTMERIVELDLAEGRAILDELMERATAPEYVYQHKWEVGDLVAFDNEGLYHRVRPFDPNSGRRLVRTNVLASNQIA